MNTNEKISKLKEFCKFYKNTFGYEKDFFMTISYKISQLNNDEDNHLFYLEELKI